MYRASSFERQPTQPECRQDEDGDLPVEDQSSQRGGRRRGGGEEQSVRSDSLPETRRHALHTISAIHGDGQHVPGRLQRRPI